MFFSSLGSFGTSNTFNCSSVLPMRCFELRELLLSVFAKLRVIFRGEHLLTFRDTFFQVFVLAIPFVNLGNLGVSLGGLLIPRWNLGIIREKQVRQ